MTGLKTSQLQPLLMGLETTQLLPLWSKLLEQLGLNWVHPHDHEEQFAGACVAPPEPLLCARLPDIMQGIWCGR